MWSLVLVSCRRASCLGDGWTCCAKSRCSQRKTSYLAYRLARGLVAGDANTAFAHARDVISVERTLHVFVEPSVQAWASGSRLLMDVLSWLYVNAQTTVTLRALVYLTVPQPLVLLRAQHVHDRDGARAHRLRRVPDGATAVHARVGLHRLRLGRNRCGPLAHQRFPERAVQPLRGRALDARRVRADGRLATGTTRALAGAAGNVVPLSPS